MEKLTNLSPFQAYGIHYISVNLPCQCFFYMRCFFLFDSPKTEHSYFHTCILAKVSLFDYQLRVSVYEFRKMYPVDSWNAVKSSKNTGRTEVPCFSHAEATILPTLNCFSNTPPQLVCQAFASLSPLRRHPLSDSLFSARAGPPCSPFSTLSTGKKER